MSTSPTPQDARASLDEANRKAATVRRADIQFRPILLGVAAIYLAAAALISLFPRGGGPFVLFIFVGGSAGTLCLAWRISAYSRMGVVWLAVSVAAFNLWNAAVLVVSMATGWLAPHGPTYHFGVSAVVGVLPLVVAAWIFGRR